MSCFHKSSFRFSNYVLQKGKFKDLTPKGIEKIISINFNYWINVSLKDIFGVFFRNSVHNEPLLFRIFAEFSLFLNIEIWIDAQYGSNFILAIRMKQFSFFFHVFKDVHFHTNIYISLLTYY